MIVTARPYAFSSPDYLEVASGSTVAEIVRDVHLNAGVPESWRSSALVMIDGEVIEYHRWAIFVPRVGANVVVSTSLYGGGGGGKNPLRSLLSIAVIAAASWAGPAAFGAAGFFGKSRVGAALVSGGVMAGGMLLVNAIAPIRPPVLQTTAAASMAESPTYSISGGRNDLRQFGVVPVCLGRHKNTPPLGTMSYTEIKGNDEYLRIVLVWGYGPLHISNIKIGETPIVNYKDLEIETVEGRVGDPALRLFPFDVFQNNVAAPLTSAAGWVNRVSQVNAGELSVDIWFPRGLTHFDNNGNRQNRTVDFDLRYRRVGTLTWINFTRQVSHANQNVSGLQVPTHGHGINIFIDRYTGRAGTSGHLLIGRIFWLWHQVQVVGQGEQAWDWVWTRTLTVENFNAPDTVGFVCSLGLNNSVDVTAGTITIPALRVTRASAQTVRISHKWGVEAGQQYEVEIRRVTPDTTDPQIIDECTWSVLRTFQVGGPIRFRRPLAMTAIRIKATEQLQGAVDDINAITTSYAPIWNGTNWNTEEPTNNPAALMRLVLRGPANERRRSAAQVDDGDLAVFFNFCRTRNYAFNMIRDFKKSVWDTCADICAAGMAIPSLIDGKWTVVIDHANKPVRQHFTPRNSWSFESSKVLAAFPHAWRVRFVNELKDYKQDEQIVYDAGFSAVNATLFEGLEFPGITRPDLIWRFGRFHIAQLRLRPEEYTFSVDFEHLACQRGDIVLISHDVTMWGLASGRIKSLLTATTNTTGIVVDENFAMEAGKNYNVRFRLSNGSSLIQVVNTVVGDNFTLTFTTPIPTTSGPQIGDLTMFGVVGTETQRVIVKRIDRAENLTARLTCVDESPAIYTADTGVIPAFTSNISVPVVVERLSPNIPSIIRVTSGPESILFVGEMYVSRINISFAVSDGVVKTAYVRVRYRIQGGVEWIHVRGEVDQNTIDVWPVNIDQSYVIQIQAVGVNGLSSSWSAPVTVIAGALGTVGTLARPLQPVVTHSIIGGAVELLWSDCRTALPISRYTVNNVIVRGQTFTRAIDWSGNKTFTIQAHDVGGRSGPVTNHIVYIPAVLAITGITAHSGTRELQIANDGTIISRIRLVWDIVQNAFVSNRGQIEIQYQSQGTAEWLSTHTTGNETAVYLVPVKDGITYNIRIRAINSIGQRGPWSQITHFAIGKTEPPPNVASFMLDGDTLRWTPIRNVADLAGYLIRLHRGNNTWWSTASPLYDGVITQTPWRMVSRLDGPATLLIKAVDTSGNVSREPAVISVNFGDVIVDNVMLTWPQAPSWPRQIINGEVINGELQAVGTDRFYGLPLAAFYRDVMGFRYLPSIWAAVSYTFDVVSPEPGELKLLHRVTGLTYNLEIQRDSQAARFGLPNNMFFGHDHDLIFGQPLPWTSWLGGVKITLPEQIRWRVFIEGGDRRGIIHNLTPTLDVPDVNEILQDVVIPSGGRRLPITQRFRRIKNVGLTIQHDGHGGRNVIVQDKNHLLGPKIIVYNAAGNPVQGLIDAHIQGF